jgi:dolichol-phosphate mannosyltransferase
MTKLPLISIIVPIYNEALGLSTFHATLMAVITAQKYTHYEVIYCDDGSEDTTTSLVLGWHAKNKNIKLLHLSRNFGKENALTAGIASAAGDIIISIDGDGQHPVELIPSFIKAWQNGAQVVVGIRTDNNGEGIIKKVGSKLFYSLINIFASQKMIPGSTDFRLITKQVQKAFLQLPESDRLTRSLIDWLGFKRTYIQFVANQRANGAASYNTRKLITLASSSLVSMTPVPLYVFGWLGVFITATSFGLGITIFIEQIMLNDPLTWNFTGTALLGIMLLFLVGILLMAQGLLSLYISHIHSQSKRRPLYVIDYTASVGINEQPNAKL